MVLNGFSNFWLGEFLNGSVFSDFGLFSVL